MKQPVEAVYLNEVLDVVLESEAVRGDVHLVVLYPLTLETARFKAATFQAAAAVWQYGEEHVSKKCAVEFAPSSDLGPKGVLCLVYADFPTSSYVALLLSIHRLFSVKRLCHSQPPRKIVITCYRQYKQTHQREY